MKDVLQGWILRPSSDILKIGPNYQLAKEKDWPGHLVKWLRLTSFSFRVIELYGFDRYGLHGFL